MKTIVSTRSHTAAIFPILLALKKFNENGTKFVGNNLQQEWLLSLMEEAMKINFDKNQIKAFISDNPKELNCILKENNVDLRVDEFQEGMAVVSLMDLVGNWFVTPARESKVEYEEKAYNAFIIEEGANYLENTTLMIETIQKGENEIVVFIEKTEVERTGIELYKYIYKRSIELNYRKKESCTAIVPFVNIKEKPDINFLVGMKSKNGDSVISQALQENLITLDHNGMHAQSATFILQSFGGNDCEIIINSPFNIWFAYKDFYKNKEEKYFPLMAAYIAQDSWQEK